MTTTATGASATAGASGRSRTKGTTTNGKPKRTFKLKNLRLEVQEAVPVGIFRAAFQEEATNEDAVKFLEAALGKEQMEQIWAIPLSLDDGPITDQVNGILIEAQTQVQKVLGLEAGE